MLHFFKYIWMFDLEGRKENHLFGLYFASNICARRLVSSNIRVPTPLPPLCSGSEPSDSQNFLGVIPS